jgi:hypothetical protein
LVLLDNFTTAASAFFKLNTILIPRWSKVMLQWLSRCIPGLSAIGLVVLLVLALGNDDHYALYSSQDGRSPAQFGPFPQRLRLSQKLLIFYLLLVHIDTVLFSCRLCFSIIVVNQKIRATLLRRHDLPSGFYSEGILQPADAKEMSSKSSQSSRSSPFDSDQLRINEPSTGEVIHAIIIPNYREDIDTLRTTLAVLASHPRARTQYEVSFANWSLHERILTLSA